MDNKQIARILRETSQLPEIDGAIIGRYRSDEKAAELIDGLPESSEQSSRNFQAATHEARSIHGGCRGGLRSVSRTRGVPRFGVSVVFLLFPVSQNQKDTQYQSPLGFESHSSANSSTKTKTANSQRTRRGTQRGTQ
jgi:hypothetical protein